MFAYNIMLIIYPTLLKMIIRRLRNIYVGSMNDNNTSLYYLLTASWSEL